MVHKKWSESPGPDIPPGGPEEIPAAEPEVPADSPPEIPQVPDPEQQGSGVCRGDTAPVPTP